MRVTVSVFSRFHAFYLANQLHKRGSLDRLITTYPKFEVVKYGIPESKTVSLWPYEAIARATNRLPAPIRAHVKPGPHLHQLFDQTAAKRLKGSSDVFVGWSGFSEESIKQARRQGAVTVVERGSAHIEYQRDILQEEYERWGIAGELPHPTVVSKEKREYALADYISIPSEFVKRTFLAKGFPAEKLVKVPYGVDLRSFRPVPKSDEVFRIIFVGGMSLQKGVHYLLQAFAELHLSGAELWLVGAKSPEIDAFFHKYEGTFRYFGPVPQVELHKYYSQCSALAICSIQDGFGMVIPQAMACGLPVICTKNTGGDELIEEGREGFIIPIRNLEALKDHISYLFHHQETCRHMGADARRKVEDGQTWDDYGEQMYAAYQQVLAKPFLNR